MGIFLDFSSLSPAERLFKEFAQPLLIQGLSGNSIIRVAQQNGLSIRRTRSLSVIRYLRGVVSSQHYVSSVNLDKQLDFGRLPYSAQPMERNYRYRVRFKGLNTTTGEKGDMWKIFQTDQRLTKEQAQGYALALLDGSGATRYFDIQASSTVQIEKNIAMYGAL